MHSVPTTSISLLKALSSGTDTVRWTEFIQRYEQVMRAYLHAKFPSVDADDAIQDTLVALARALPDYHHTPDARGHFHNYLIGILAHKAADLLSRGARLSTLRKRLLDEQRSGLRRSLAAGDAETGGFCEMRPREEPSRADDEALKTAAMEVAIDQLMSDTRIQPTTREVFRHVALLHERPEDVARLFGLSRNNVDQIKNRLVRRLAETARALLSEFSAS